MPGIKPMYRNIKATIIDEDLIIVTVCEYFNLPFDKLLKKDRQSNVVLARNILIYFLFKYTTLSKSDIARMLNKDHTTVIHSFRALQDRIDTEEIIKERIDEIRSKIVSQL
jgi:chromosomal replication initiator protein